MSTVCIIKIYFIFIKFHVCTLIILYVHTAYVYIFFYTYTLYTPATFTIIITCLVHYTYFTTLKLYTYLLNYYTLMYYFTTYTVWCTCSLVHYMHLHLYLITMNTMPIHQIYILNLLYYCTVLYYLYCIYCKFTCTLQTQCICIHTYQS